MNKIDDILDEMDDVIDKAKPFPFAGNKYICLLYTSDAADD